MLESEFEEKSDFLSFRSDVNPSLVIFPRPVPNKLKEFSVILRQGFMSANAANFTNFIKSAHQSPLLPKF